MRLLKWKWVFQELPCTKHLLAKDINKTQETFGQIKQKIIDIINYT